MAAAKRRDERKGRPKKQKVRWNDLTDDEVMAIVVNLFIRGQKAAEIARHMHAVYKQDSFNRQDSYRFVRRAAERGMLSWSREKGPGRNPVQEQRIHERFAGLNGVHVVASLIVADIASHAARAIVDWMRQKSRTNQPGLRIGLMGGGTVMAVCQALARELSELTGDEKAGWPPLGFHALAVGDNVRQPLEDPASFFTYFADIQLEPLRRRYVGVHAPVFRVRGAVDPDPQAQEFEQLRAEARACDIVIVSAGDIDDKHSFLGGLKQSAPATWARLHEEGVRGDFGRLPVSPDGPTPLDLFEHPPCTLIGLDDLRQMVRERRRVMLVAAPCGDCRKPKSDIVQTLLELRNRGCQLFTDLVCDSRTVQGMTVMGNAP